MPLAIRTQIPYLDADNYSQVYSVNSFDFDGDNEFLITDAYESFIYQDTDELVILKYRRDINDNSNDKVREVKRLGQVHMDPEVFVGASHAGVL